MNISAEIRTISVGNFFPTEIGNKGIPWSISVEKKFPTWPISVGKKFPTEIVQISAEMLTEIGLSTEMGLSSGSENFVENVPHVHRGHWPSIWI